jgi:formate dehydrogenase major subunit
VDEQAATRPKGHAMSLSRRSWLKLAAGGGAGLALGELVSMPEAHAAAGKLKLADVKEYTTACNFCSVGCGMVGRVRDGELVNLEGDPDHVINQGSLCAKGSAMIATHVSDQRVKNPLYRAPGSDRWQEISWDEAIAKVAKKIKEVRDATWMATDKDGDADVPVNRTDAIGFLGGAQNTNEECYMIQKAARVFGTAFVEHQARL